MNDGLIWVKRKFQGGKVTALHCMNEENIIMREEPVEVIEYKGKEIKIYSDFNPQNPRTEWDNLGHMICWHRNYILGDKHDYRNPDEFIESLYNDIDGKDASELYDRHTNDRATEIMQKVIDKHYILIPLSLYDHGGITMKTGSFSDPWDSGPVGWIYISIADVKKEYGWKVLTKARRQQVCKYLDGEVKVYDCYLTGAVYGYDTGEDSCWGFYGYDHKASGLLEMAENAIDCQVQEERKARKIERAERKQAAREKIQKATEFFDSMVREQFQQEASK
jgi:hypothetical protein